MKYPRAKRGIHRDIYHGQEVLDPYRSLEDIHSESTQSWIKAQNELTESYLSQCRAREQIEARLIELSNYERVYPPIQCGKRLFFWKNPGLNNFATLYYRDGLRGKVRELLDPNKLSNDGSLAIAGVSTSHDGKLLAYGVSRGGSDWSSWKVRDVESGREFPEVLGWIKFSRAAWTTHNEGFFYSRYPAPPPGHELSHANLNSQIYYHYLGTQQEQDTLVYTDPHDPEVGCSPQVTYDGRYLIVYTWKGASGKVGVLYKDLQGGEGLETLITGFEEHYQFVGNKGQTFFFITTHNAPRKRIVAINITDPRPESWVEVVAESEEVIEDAVIIDGDTLVVHTLRDASDHLVTYNLDGKNKDEIKLPELGTISPLQSEPESTNLFFSFSSFTRPATIYRYDFKKRKLLVWWKPALQFDPDLYQTKQVWYPSKDGTHIPMFLVSNRKLERNGRNPVELYGYGGFNVSLPPTYSAAVVLWLELGGIFAQPSLRGGGEYGEVWHTAGTRERKQNVFDDFISAAEYLIRENLTDPTHLSISGGSNGGLLVGSVVTQRPDLFSCVTAMVGVFDMLRFHRFTIGAKWVDEYGCADNQNDFPFLIAYSPLHNIRAGINYPPMLITTGDHDDRVFPAHSYKFAATLQFTAGGTNPHLLRVETDSGHGALTPLSKLISLWRDTYTFRVKQLNIDTTPLTKTTRSDPDKQSSAG